MSYNQQSPPPQGQYQQYAPPGAPPPGAYGAPPPQPYGQPAYVAPPQQGHAPPAGQYPPPPGQPGYPQQQYAPPPSGQYAPPPGQYAPPPPGQYPPPPGQYAPPPAGQYAPPPAPYGAPQGYPQQFYAPPPQGYPAAPHGYPQPPPTGYPAPPAGYPAQPAYGAPQPAYGQPAASYPQQQYGAPAVAPRTYLGAQVHPSENLLLPVHERTKESVAVDGYDPAKDVETIKKATKGFGTNEGLITGTLVSLPAVRLPLLAYAYKARHGTSLHDLLKKELGGNYETLILLLIKGPLLGDVELIQKACLGAGTNETLLNDLIISRPPSSIELLRASYLAQTRTSLDSTVLSELSFKTKAAFTVALLGEWRDQPDGGRSAGTVGGFGGAQEGVVNPAMVEEDIKTLAKAIKATQYGETTVDETLLSSIVFARSPLHLHHLQIAYLKARKIPLTRQVKRHITGHLRDALLYALEGGKKDTTGCWRDAKMLEKTMAGMGTKDDLLIIRLVRAHWDKQRFRAVQTAYQAKYGKTLASAVMKETSGDYRDGLMALINAI